MSVSTPDVGWNQSGMGWGSDDMNALKAFANQSEDLYKAYSTGEGIVSEGTGLSGDASKLRVQFLHDVLEQVSFEMDDARLFKSLKKEKVYSNTFEWSAILLYGGAGDGFVQETGTGVDGAGNPYFGVAESNDAFARQVLQIKFLCAVRNLSLVSTLVNNVSNIEKTAEMAATRELVSKCNLALYFGDGRISSTQFNGLARQIMDYVSYYSQTPSIDQVSMYDAGNVSIDKVMMEELCVQNRQVYGRISECWSSPTGYGDLQKNLFPEARYIEGAGGNFGVDKRKFKGPYGDIEFFDDPMFRPNRPLVADGPGVTGLPRTVADSGALGWNSSLVAASGQTFPTTFNNPTSAGTDGVGVAAGSPGIGNWWANITQNSAIALTIGTPAVTNPAAVPALPSGAGNQSNHVSLAANSYYYAVSIVYGGKESVAFYVGAASGLIGAAVATSVTAGQVVSIAINTAMITGVTMTAAIGAQIKFRVYRAPGTLTVGTTLVPTAFSLLHETGCPGSGLAVSYDNGMYVPGTDNIFLLTKKRNGADGIFLAQLLPLMKRSGLPETILGTPLAMLLFAAPIMLVPRHHMWVRNIARYS